MKIFPSRPRWLAPLWVGVGMLVLNPSIGAQTVLPTLATNDVIGKRPYEMVWAHRQEPAPPTVRFDHLAGWTMRVVGGAHATLQVTRAQNVWNRPVARLRYRGNGHAQSGPRIVLQPPKPVSLPDGADSVDMWVYGNRWEWEHPAGTPPVRILLQLRDGNGKVHNLSLDNVRWQQWWLIHKQLPRDLEFPVHLEAVVVTGGWQPAWREIFLDSIRFYHEPLPPLHFAPLPRRNLKLFAHQSPGANTGPGRLPFPTRPQTILPLQFEHPWHNRVEETGGQFRFHYRAADGKVTYRFDPKLGLAGLYARFDGVAVGRLTQGARVQFGNAKVQPTLSAVTLTHGVVTAVYSDNTTLRLRIWQKSLVVDVINRTGRATGLSFGELTGLTAPRTVWVPYINYGSGPHPCVLLSQAGVNLVFTSLWLDWYHSNASAPYAAESAGTDTARINGGVRYIPRTDGRRNPLFERFFITVSPRFTEVLPTVANPVGLHAKEATDRLWQETWGPANFEKEMERSARLRAYGIAKLIQCNHEIAWRDNGESFTLRLHAAPKKGGDVALERYVAHQRKLGWLAGLYSNYTDYAPVNRFWSPDGVQRTPSGEWRTAWPRCYAEKPLKAVEFDALLAPKIEAKYHPNSAYTDVHTAVAPWSYTDYDARVPGAGTFAQTFYAYGQLLRNDSRVYGGPIFSEGTYQWLYAGLPDGNYGLAYDGRPLAQAPLLPVFDLYQLHSKECDIGMGWTAYFCGAIPNWQSPAHLDYAIDRFLLNTLAYGHIGWLVEETHGIDRTCRSYYMLQQVQARYGLKVPTRIAYWDGSKLVSVSEAIERRLPSQRRQLFVAYPGGLELWLNDNATENWRVSLAGYGFGVPALTLPPAGWVALTRDWSLFSYSALDGTNRVDYCRSPAYTYLDGRGHWFATAAAAANGGLAIKPLGTNRLQVIHISGTGSFVVRRPYHVQGACIACAAFDVEGKPLSAPIYHDNGSETRVEPVAQAVRYVLRFKPTQ